MLAWKIFLSESKSLLFFELKLKLQVLDRKKDKCTVSSNKEKTCFLSVLIVVYIVVVCVPDYGLRNS